MIPVLVPADDTYLVTSTIVGKSIGKNEAHTSSVILYEIASEGEGNTRVVPGTGINGHTIDR